MKTIEEIYKMSVDELVTYCDTLKLYEVDRQTFKVVEIDDIVVSDIRLNRVNGYICLDYYYCCIRNHADTTDILYRIHKIPENMNYSGIFDNDEDAINAAKQFAKHEKQELMNMLEQEHTTIIRNIKSLKQEIDVLG